MKLVVAVVVLAVLVPAAPAAAARDRTPPSTPTDVRVVSVTEDSITISWTASKDNSGRIHAYIAGGIYHPGTSTTKTFTSLVPNWTQTYRVQAMDPSGNESALSAPVTGTTAPDRTAPTAPANLRVTATGPSTANLSWGAAFDRWSVVYDVLVDGAVRATSGSLSTELRGLTPGATHTFTVRARDNGGNVGPVSNAVSVAFQASSDTTPPSAPTNLTARDFGDFCGSNVLDWTGSTDDTDPPSAIRYEVFRGGLLWHVTPGGVTEAFLYTFPGGTNTWTVVAFDQAGNRSAPSNSATVTVVADPDLC